MKIAIGQTRIYEGNVEKNFVKVLNAVHQSTINDVDLLVLPNGCLLGDNYANFLNVMNEETIHYYLEKLVGLCKNVKILLKENDYYLIDNTGYQKVEQKIQLLDRDFSLDCDGNDITICFDNKLYTRDKEREFDKNGLINIVVSGVGLKHLGKVVALLDGGSYIYDQDKKIISLLDDDFKEDFRVYQPGSVTVSPICDHKLFEALVAAIKFFDEESFNSSVKWLIGLSGGIDSTISAGLLTYALGAERLVGFNLASKYNSDATKNNANQIANNLQIPIHNGSIEEIVEATSRTCEMYDYHDCNHGIVLENVQARSRGHLLQTFSSIEKGIVINNGNKVEVALGYCTLHGDAVGGISFIGDLYKTDLFEIGSRLNKLFNKEVVPYNLMPSFVNGEMEWLTKPSAELRDAQLDPMKWFYHDYVIEEIIHGRLFSFMEHYMNNKLADTKIDYFVKYYDLTNPENFIADLEWLINTMSFNRFKRLQTPPLLKVTDAAFGYDFNESAVNIKGSITYNRLKDEILNVEM